MITESLERINGIRDEISSFLEKGGSIYLDNDLHLNITRKAPKADDVRLSLLTLKSKAHRQKAKLANAQQQFARFEVAFKSDIQRLEKKLKKLQAQLSEEAE